MTIEDDYPDTMKPGTLTLAAGSVMLLIGVLVSVLAFMLETSVEPPLALDLPTLDRVNNVGLLQRQMMMLHVGLALSSAE
jgi:hypothetical protein